MNADTKFNYGDEDPNRPGYRFQRYRCGRPVWLSPQGWLDQISRRDAQRAAKRATPEGRGEHLCNNARDRAARNHLPFDLNAGWIAAAIRACNGKCPVLGIEFDLTGADHRRSITLDRVIPMLGYQVGRIPNVRVVCLLVNDIKGKRVRGDDLRNAKSFRFSREAQLIVADYIDRSVGEVAAALNREAA
jgi:hypothetical protein